MFYLCSSRCTFGFIGYRTALAMSPQSYDDLFKVDDGEATLEDIIGSNKKRRRSAAGPSEGLSFFGPREVGNRSLV